MKTSSIRLFRQALIWAPVVLAACGGGGDSGSPPVNLAPTFTSSAQVTVDENTSGTLYTFAATDPDGNSLSISVVPGGDEAAFDIDIPSRTIRALTLLDFEAPADANGDNVYEVTLEARDTGGLSARLNLQITVRDVFEDMMLTRVGDGFSQPLYLAGLPGTTQVIVLEKQGRIRILDPQTGTIDPVDFLDVSGETAAAGEGGLLGIAFSPDFATDGTFYINMTNLSGDTEIRRYAMFSGSTTQADPSTADVILTIAQPATNHNGGWIGFAADGLLFVATGDADTTRDYAIPPGNAFAAPAGREEIFALGLRNPWRASFDRVTGDLFIGDVGQDAVEEIDRLRMSDSGTNFGWDDQEGTQDFEAPDRAGLTDPVAEYFHGDGPARGESITGGYVYRGNIERIKDTYVFADFVIGNIWAVPVDGLVIGQTMSAGNFDRLNASLVPDAGTLASIASFGEDNDRNLYIVSVLGDVFRIDIRP